MTNPLLTPTTLPQFSKIKPEHVVPAIEELLSICKETTEKLLQQKEYSWENFCLPLEEVNDRLGKAWSPVSHLNSVKNSPELREAYEACLPLLSEYSTWIGQHQGLYLAYKQISESEAFTQFTTAQKKSIQNSLRDFKLSGIALEPKKQQRYAEISIRKSELSSKFSNNVLDATMGWEKVITNPEELKGLPESALLAAQASAQSKNLEGYRLTLEFPSYLPVMTYCENRSLREEMYRAFNTRASDQGPNAGKWDNSQLIDEILALRHELAQLLGYKNYAELSLATKMAETPQQVLDFLDNLAYRAKPQGEKELTELKEFCNKNFHINELAPWDITFYSEKLKQELYSINDEELRPYFPENRVVKGLFEVIKRLYNIEVKERFDIDLYDPSVRFFELKDKNDQLIGSFYLDLYAREHKRGGAWMDDCVGREVKANGEVQHPVAYLTCNFNKPLGDKPALFTHDEVTTLFHEFGHGLHHMLTRIDVGAVAGINGVPWDAVELPSQFMENWCWEEEALAFISGHYETNEPLPKEKLDQLLAAKNFQAAMFVLRQLEFGLFDFRLHAQYDPEKGSQLLETLSAVKEEVSLFQNLPWSRFPHAFSHIFAGGYAAGYYSYMWAEVLSADAFSMFEEQGIFNPKTGRAFLEKILSQGGSAEPMELFKNFRGREPQLDALLRHKGIA